MKQGDETGEQILFHLFAYSGAYPFSFPELQSAAMSWIQINVIPKLSVVNIIIHKRYSWQLTVSKNDFFAVQITDNSFGKAKTGAFRPHESSFDNG